MLARTVKDQLRRMLRLELRMLLAESKAGAKRRPKAARRQAVRPQWTRQLA